MHRSKLFLGGIVVLAGILGYIVTIKHTQEPQTVKTAVAIGSSTASTDSVSAATSAAKRVSLARPVGAQPIPLRKAYERSDDLYSLGQDLRIRADHGDVEAALVLIDLESECRAFVLSGGASLPGHDLLVVPDMYVQKHPEARAYVNGLRQREQARCGRFTKAGFETYEQQTARLKQAAKGQSAEAAARLLSFDAAHWESIPEDQLASAVKEIVASGDPNAIFALSGPMSNPNREQLFDVPSGSEGASDAYVLAACQMGMDCGPTSQLLANLCFNGSACGYPSYDALLTGALLPPSEVATVRQMAKQIVEKAGRHP